MNLYSIIATLLATSVSADYYYGGYPGFLQPASSYYSPAYAPSYLGSDDPQPGDKCYHGNQRNVAPATQAPYPPCWYKQGDGAWACFNKVNGQCPWGGAKNPPGSGGNNGICYHGNQRNVPPATQAPYPPCWYKQSDGAWACFNQVNGQCPWPGAVGPQASAYLSAPSFLGGDDPQPGDKCYHGNQRNVAPATQAPYPPCWYKQSDGAWACFNQVNGKCPWDGAKNPPGSGGNSNTCYAGNMRDKPITSNYPPCWYKQSDGAWACFDKVNGQCPWGGAVGPQASAYLSAPAVYNSRPFCYNGAQRNSPNYGPNWPACWYRPNGKDWDCYNKVNGQCPWPGAVGPQVSAFLNAPSFLGSDDPQPGDKCYHGNQRNVAPATQAPYPPCWYKQGDGAWACFNKVNGQCPWGGAKNPPGSGGNNGICYHGNQRNVPPATQAPYPPCWYKQSDGAWACFNKVNGQCPWSGAVGPQASFY